LGAAYTAPNLHPRSRSMTNSKLILVLPTNRVGLVLEALNGEFSELSVIPCEKDFKTKRNHKPRTNLSPRELALIKIIEDNPGIGLKELEPKFESTGFHGPTASPIVSKLTRIGAVRYEGTRPRQYFISG